MLQKVWHDAPSQVFERGSIVVFCCVFCLQTPLISANFSLLTFIPQEGVGGGGVPPLHKKVFVARKDTCRRRCCMRAGVQIAESSEYIWWLQFRFEIMLNVQVAHCSAMW